MRTLIILAVGIIAIGCNPNAELEKKVVGTYEAKDGKRVVLLDNGIVELYENGKKDEVEHKWSISKEGEIHATDSEGDIFIFRINKDGSITIIARIRDGKKEEAPKEAQMTFKKIK